MARTVPLVIVSPVRDEGDHIRHTLDAVIAQTCLPVEWLLVDDGSTDDTVDVISEYLAHHPFIRVVRRPDRGRRELGGGVIQAFDYGLSMLVNDDYRYVAKMDGDMSFGPRYLEIMLDALEADPALAAVSGQVFRPEGDALVREYQIPEQVAGQFKLYKREAFEAIGGFEQTILWDGIDIHRCRMLGYTTRSFFHPEARLIHHRQMGSSDRSVYRGRLRLGRGIWFMGYDPLYALASGIFRMQEKPYVIGGLIIIAGYLWAALRREPRYADAAFRTHLQHWQRARLGQLLRNAFSLRRFRRS